MASPAFAILAETANSWGFPLSAKQLDQFRWYAAELQRWNERINLTAITDLDGIAIRHFLDSLYCARVWGDTPRTLIDIGSGAGFPGLPLKILYPPLHLTLVESVGKKVTFLRHIVDLLGLEHVMVLDTRAEAVGRDTHHREAYDVATARGVAELRVVAEYCLPFIRLGGRFLAPKGAAVADEITEAQPALEILGGRLLTVEQVSLPGVDSRTLVVVIKIAPTPPKYPRTVGVPARRPL